MVTLLTSSTGVDGSVELRLCGLHQRPVCGRAEQRHPAAGWGPEGGGREALMLQRATQTVPVQPLPAQRNLQGGLESLRLRLLWDGLPGTLLWERWEWHRENWTGLDWMFDSLYNNWHECYNHIFTIEMSKLANNSHWTATHFVKY